MPLEARIRDHVCLAEPYAIWPGWREVCILRDDGAYCTARLSDAGKARLLNGTLPGFDEPDWEELGRQFCGSRTDPGKWFPDMRPPGSGREFSLSTLGTVASARDRYQAAHAIRAWACRVAYSCPTPDGALHELREAERHAQQLEQAYADSEDVPCEPPWREWMKQWGYL